MTKNKIAILLLVVCCVGCVSSDMEHFQKTAIAQSKSAGSNYGTIVDVAGLYMHRDYQKSLQGSTYLLHHLPPSYLNNWWQHYRAIYKIRAKSNAALHNYDDAQKDFLALEANTYNNSDINGYLSIIDYKKNSNAASAVEIANRLPQPAEKGHWYDYAQTGAHAYYLSVIYMMSGNIYAAKNQLVKARASYQHLQTTFKGTERIDQMLLSQWTARKKLIDIYISAIDNPDVKQLQHLKQTGAGHLSQVTLAEWVEVFEDTPYDPFIIDLVYDSLEQINRGFAVNGVEKTTQFINTRQYPQGWSYLGKAYASLRSEAVVGQIARMLRVNNPKQLSEESRRYLAQANVHLESRDYEQALAAYDKVIEFSPWAVDAYYNQANIYATAQHYGDAIQTMKHYLILVPHGPRSRKAQDAIYRWEVSASAKGRQ